MAEIEKLIRKNVLGLTPYSSARDEFTGKSGIFLDANENPFGNLNRYPDPYQNELKYAIAGYKGIDPSRIFLGNGSDEIIDLCIRVFCNPGQDKILTFTPTYGMYEVSASINDVGVIKVPLDSSFNIDVSFLEAYLGDSSLKLIFICSPNNPTGNAMDFGTVEKIIATFEGVVVVDEAYSDFSEKPSFTGLLNRYDNLVVMQTFSKAFGLASVRVGMAFTNPLIIKYFNKVKPPYNISTVNQKAALKRLEEPGKIRAQVEKIRGERTRIRKSISKMNFTREIFPSDSNFLLVRVDDATGLYNSLIEDNIIIRNRTSIIENCVRITVGTKAENSMLIKALKDYERKRTEKQKR